MSQNFILTFGKKPYNFINRFEDTNKIINSFELDQPTEQTFLITGVRGSGKTVLLTSVSNYFMDKSDWIVVDLNPNNDLLEELVSKLYQNTKLKALFLKKEFSLSFHGISININYDTPPVTADCWIERIIENLTKQGKKVLITIDEACNSPTMKSFAHVFQALLRKNLLVFLLMTGLFENINEIQNNKTSTFLLRSPRIFLNSLNLGAISKSYKTILGISDKTALKLSKTTEGYAFAYQLLGYLLQSHHKQELDEEILAEYDQYLSEFVYEKIWSELSKAEQELLSFFKTNDEIEVKELIKRSGKTSSYLSLYRDRLIKKGIIKAPSYGHLCFSLPRFNEFIEFNYFE